MAGLAASVKELFVDGNIYEELVPGPAPVEAAPEPIPAEL